MLKNTFCHLNRIGPKKEAFLWQQNILSWADLMGTLSTPVKKLGIPASASTDLQASFSAHDDANAAYFADRLNAKDTWRLFADFRPHVAYVDIETTGLYDPDITTIALYDGSQIKYYVSGQNLEQFKVDIASYRLLITYNGKTFDIPIIENFFKIKLPHAHIDLRYVLKSLGYSGGLKRCEKQLGISRGDLDGVDGFFAVLLWNDYCENRNNKALETLLSYNIEDVVNLEKLMVMAYNKKLTQLNVPFIETIAAPDSPEIPFSPDMATIDRIRYHTAATSYY